MFDNTVDGYFEYMQKPNKFLLILSLVNLFAVVSCTPTPATKSDTVISEDGQIGLQEKAAQAWLYFYPLLMIQASQVAYAENMPNAWHHSDPFKAQKSATDVERKVDTVLSHAWLDLRDGPINLRVPDMGGRYYVVQAIDQWAQTFSTIGSRTSGSRVGPVVYLPPGMRHGENVSGHWPIDATFIESPSYDVLLLAHVQRGAPEQARQIPGLRSQFSLHRHAETFQSQDRKLDSAVIEIPASLLESLAEGLTPSNAVLQLEPSEYFAWATALWGSKYGSLSAQDREFANQIIQLGVYPGRAIQWQDLTERRQLLLEAAANAAKSILTNNMGAGNTAVHNGWRYPSVDWYATEGHRVRIQQPGNYSVRAQLAFTRPDYLPRSEVISLSAHRYSTESDTLSGARGQQYVIRFKPNELPPADAFWSLLVSSQNGGRPDNLLGRNRLGSDDQLLVAGDGSVTIYLSAGNPYGERSSNTANWLPIPAGNFSLEFRAYLPGRNFGAVDGGWVMPAIMPREYAQ